MNKPSHRTLSWCRGIEADGSFSQAKLFRHPSHLLKRSQPSNPKQVVVVGGGIAGLAAGYELTRLGHTVTILEASPQAGGRLRTARFTDGTFSEIGAMRIPDVHDCVLHYCNEFSIPTRPFVNYNPKAFLYLRGKKSQLGSGYEEFYDLYDLPDHERMHPFQLLENTMKKLLAPFSHQQMFEMFADQLVDDSLNELDQLTFFQLLSRELSQGGVEFILYASGLAQYQQCSAKAVIIDWWGLFNSGQFQIVGGMDKFTGAFTERLKRNIDYDTRVTEVNLQGEVISVSGMRSTGEKVSYLADYVIFATPARATSLVDFRPPLANQKLEALRNLNYASAHKTLIRVKERFWELEEGIAGGGSFTDLPIQSVWYPSDNANPVYDDNDKRVGWTIRDPEVSHSPGVLTAAYTWGNNSRLFASMTESEQTETVLKSLRQLHGPNVDSYVEEVLHWIWDNDQNRCAGGFAFFGPGEHSRYQTQLCLPHPTVEQPRVFFAGEHVAVAHAWIQGAIQSALSAAISVHEAPGVGRQAKAA